MNKLQVSNIIKKYPNNFYAINNISFEASNGIIGMLGPNGAGKTTLLRIIATIISPTAGNITLNGLDSRRDLKNYRNQIGYLPQHFGLYPSLSAYEHLLFFGQEHTKENKTKYFKLLKQLGLDDVAYTPSAKLSGGMKQRLGIAISLVNNPKLLILDEPTSGLDPQERIRFRMLVEKIAHHMIVIISTHIVQDIELGCSKIILVNHGSILRTASPESFTSLAKNNTFSLRTTREHCENIKRSRRVTSIVELDQDLVEIKFVGNALNEGEKLTPPSIEDAYIFFLSAEGWRNDDEV